MVLAKNYVHLGIKRALQGDRTTANRARSKRVHPYLIDCRTTFISTLLRYQLEHLAKLLMLHLILAPQICGYSQIRQTSRTVSTLRVVLRTIC